jgi:hypothetical protein
MAWRSGNREPFKKIMKMARCSCERCCAHLAGIVNDEGLVLDLLRSQGRSIGGDLDVGEEGSEQMIVTLQSLRHNSIGYQHMCTRVGLAKKAYPCKCN